MCQIAYAVALLKIKTLSLSHKNGNLLKEKKIMHIKYSRETTLCFITDNYVFCHRFQYYKNISMKNFQTE